MNRHIDDSQYWYNQGRKMNRPCDSSGTNRGRKKKQTYRLQSVFVQPGAGKRNRPIDYSQYLYNQGQEKGTDL